MKKSLLIFAFSHFILFSQAQKFPVGIVSVQDTVKSVQVGVISGCFQHVGPPVQRPAAE